MTTKVIVYSRPGGGVSVVGPAPSYIAGLIASGMTENEAIASIQSKDVPTDATNVEVMDRTLIPISREFRNAWEKLGVGPPTVNMPKARALHAKKISAVKAKAVIALQKRADVATLEGRTAEAAEAVSSKAAVEGLSLATLAAQIAAALNPTALSAIWPTDLQEFRP